MTGRIAIFGYGPVGRELIVAQRRAPPYPPKGATFVACDALDREAMVKAARGAEQIVAAIGFAFGRAWQVPCAQIRATRDILKIAAETLGVKLRISAMPAWMRGASAMFSPFLREPIEMRFQWDRPYHVDSSRFASTFWSDAKPFETGVRETALAFRAALKRRR
jgi:hypothetical protein